MKIQRICNTQQPQQTQPNFTGIKVLRALNKDKLFMYNDVLDLMHQHKLGGTINNEGVEVPNYTRKFLYGLKKLGLVVTKTDKKK